VEAGEFDFGMLPPVDLPSQTVPARPVPVTAAKPKFTPSGPASVTASVLHEDKNQQLLLGVGLAVAVMAIIAVLGLGALSLTRPLPTTAPVIKSVEDGDGRQVFIVRE
jgi:serine/threonine-protein kinase